MFKELIKDQKLGQHARMIKMMRRAGDKGVANHEFANAGILSYSRRVFELKRDGWDIIMERGWRGDRATNTFYYSLREEERD